MAWRQTTSRNYAFLPPPQSAVPHCDRMFQNPVDLHYQLDQPKTSLAIARPGQPDMRLGID